ASGQSTNSQQTITVTAPLQASFTAQPTDLTVTFTDTSTGAVASRSWDFGDGSPADTNSPTQHTYAQGGTYTVTLTISDASGQSTNSQQTITVAAPAPTQAPPTQQTIVDTTPILPDFNALHDALTGIYTNGASAGDSAHVFGYAGDSVFTQGGILSPFATDGQYDLNSHNDLQAIVTWFSSADLGGNNSFNHPSMAVNGNWMAQDLLDPSKADPSCNGDAPLACELHQIHPVLLFVAIGTNDARNNTDAGTFQNNLNQIVSTISANGTIPVLLTLPDDGSIPNLEAINEGIIAVAQQNHVPLLNVTRALRELNGGTNLNTAPNGPGALGGDATGAFGVNALNLDLLQILNDARNIIFPNAS
ncbi:MAG TPA: PKD domain-containing protein, partial [Phototrophicaceae bacterium]|nr:PKD domain-containing protein [Phototrophicaceae bacterium]